MQTKVCPLCPIEVGPQPIDNFGLCRSRRDGRNLYCKSCVRKKVYEGRQALKEFRARRREVKEASRESEPLFVDQHVTTFRYRLTPQERVKEAISNGARTQKEIAKETKLNEDQVSDTIAKLLLETREIRTEVIDNKRAYFINEKPEVSRKPSLPASFTALKGLGPVMKGEKKVKGWVAA